MVRGITLPESDKAQKKSVFSRAITEQDVISICGTIGLDDSSLSFHQLHPLLETFAAGSAWGALSKLTGSDVIPLSSKLYFSTPIEIGDTITAMAEEEERTNEGTLKVRLLCHNQRAELVLQGWALVTAVPPS